MHLPTFLGKRKSSQTGLHALFGWGNAPVFAVIGLSMVLIGILAWDASVFYAVQNAATGDLAAPLPARILQEKDLNETIKLLDNRAGALDTFLGLPPPVLLPPAVASSTLPVAAPF